MIINCTLLQQFMKYFRLWLWCISVTPSCDLMYYRSRYRYTIIKLKSILTIICKTEITVADIIQYMNPQTIDYPHSFPWQTLKYTIMFITDTYLVRCINTSVSDTFIVNVFWKLKCRNFIHFYVRYNKCLVTCSTIKCQLLLRGSVPTGIP